jgi:DedD protein
MDQGLKERLIGAAVLVALGVWLIPWVLDGKQEQLEVDASGSGLRLPSPDEPLPIRTQTLRLDEPIAEPSPSDPAAEQEATQVASAVPRGDTPVVSAEAETHTQAPEPEPAKAEAVSAAPKAESAVTPPKPVTAPTAAPKPPPAAATGKGDWVVQIGSFGDEDNAKRQAQRVNTYGYKPEVSSVRANGRAMYRVRVGPYATRAQADATASSLAAHGFVAQVVSSD